MNRKIISIGDSVGVTLPQKAIQQLGLSVGDEVVVDYNPRQRKIEMSPIASVDPDIVRLTSNFIKRYRTALNALSKK